MFTNKTSLVGKHCAHRVMRASKGIMYKEQLVQLCFVSIQIKNLNQYMNGPYCGVK